MVKKPDKKIIITIAIVALSVAALGWFTFFYETKLIREKAETIQEKKLESLVLQEKKDKISKLKKELEDIENNKSEMDKMLIKKDDVVPFIRSLEEIADDTSNSIKIEAADLNKLKIGEPKKAAKNDEEDAAKPKTKEEQAAADQAAEKEKQNSAGNIKKNIGFSVELTGTFPAAINFLDKMENLPYFILVYNMDLTEANKSKPPVAAGGGVLSAGSPSVSPEALPESKNIKMTMLIIVNTNDGN
ncbi:MAG: hypothetical protein Q8L09_04125 [Candidatus Moranbacteria bacterium]|nr:hypothetical protein [Candidatus Moranbacteria bacterium]